MAQMLYSIWFQSLTGLDIDKHRFVARHDPVWCQRVDEHTFRFDITAVFIEHTNRTVRNDCLGCKVAVEHPITDVAFPKGPSVTQRKLPLPYGGDGLGNFFISAI